MALTATEAAKFDNQNIVAQEISLAAEVKANQDDITTAEANITNILAGKGITLPTSDPGVAGELWADTLVVKVSAGS